MDLGTVSGIGTLQRPVLLWCEGVREDGRPCKELLGKIIDGLVIMAHRKRVLATPLRDGVTIQCECGWTWRSDMA